MWWRFLHLCVTFLSDVPTTIFDICIRVWLSGTLCTVLLKNKTKTKQFNIGTGSVRATYTCVQGHNLSYVAPECSLSLAEISYVMSTITAFRVGLEE